MGTRGLLSESADDVFDFFKHRATIHFRGSFMVDATVLRVFGFLLPMKRMWLQSVLSVQGLMQLLMKQRNGEPWSPADRLAIRGHLKVLGELTPALALFALPGGTLLLPILAWFLDRRRAQQQRAGSPPR